jgi:hypothetical protein
VLTSVQSGAPAIVFILLSRAGSCHWDWESRDSTPWKLSTAALLATSTSMVENLKWRSSQRWRPKISNPFLNFKVVFHLGWTSATQLSQAAASAHQKQRTAQGNRKEAIHFRKNQTTC